MQRQLLLQNSDIGANAVTYSGTMYFLLFINSHLFSIYLSNFALTYFQRGIAKGKKVNRTSN